MTTDQETRVLPSERRAVRRFDMHLPALIKLTAGSFHQFITETHNVSARGVFFFTDTAMAPNCRLEVTLTLPSQANLADSVRVRFSGRVVRVEPSVTSQIGVAALIEEYEFVRSPSPPLSASDFNLEWKTDY